MEAHQDQMLSETEQPNKSPARPLRPILDVIETLILSVILFVAIDTVSARVRVDGSSMEPTLHTGEFVFVNKVTYKLSQPRRGDVIVFHYPRNPQENYIKRVIGSQGDKVEVRGGKVYVNGQNLQEPYIAASPNYTDTWTVPEGQLFVLGDNRNNSSDSHSWGFVPLDYVIGKATFVYWPLENWGNLEYTASAAP